MKSRRTTKLASLAASLAAVGLVVCLVYYDQQNASPGDITSAHAQDSRLIQPGGCAACHGTMMKSSNRSCLGCHEDIAFQLSSQQGVHGHAPAELRNDCSKCHSEHHGRNFRLVSERSFTLAGIPDPSRFDHAGLDFRLVGKHLRLACERCHRWAGVEVPPKGKKRFLGLNQQCTSCHQDVHEGSCGDDCASCHGQEEPYARVAAFTHTSAFPLVGAHAKVACLQCHPKQSRYSVEALSAITRRTRGELRSSSEAVARNAGKSGAREVPVLVSLLVRRGGNPPESVRVCADCHASPHGSTFLARIAQQLRLTPKVTCQQCHQATCTTFVGSATAMSRQLHAATGFPLSPPHDQASCAECHLGFGQSKQSGRRFDVTYPGRGPDRCDVCHTDPHRAQFANGPFRGQGCLACHDRRAFRPSTFGVEQHQATRFPLTDAHLDVACNDCHMLVEMPATAVGGPGKTRIFAGTPTSCESCHRDPHRAQFVNGLFGGQGCLACHDRRAFQPSTFSVEQHQATRFPLTGAHQAVACNDCHMLVEMPATAVGGPGRKRIFAGTPTSCESCHLDMHHGIFDRPGLPKVVDGFPSCVRCHVTERFDRLRGEFDHTGWTDYALQGAHARTSCQGCHSSATNVEPDGATFANAAGTRCNDCHRDPHAGQFQTSSGGDCGRCHTVTESFHDLVFDHQTQSRFPLDDNHVRLPCSDCHRTYELPNGETVVRYKPLGIVCGDCHVLPKSGRKHERNGR